MLRQPAVRQAPKELQLNPKRAARSDHVCQNVPSVFIRRSLPDPDRSCRPAVAKTDIRAHWTTGQMAGGFGGI